MSVIIGILDYGLGNIHSVEKAFAAIDVKAKIIEKSADIESSDGIVIPGVGAFRNGMKGMEKRGFIAPIKEHAEKGKPLMGICLGMQFLLSYSEEFGRYQGLDLIPGKVVYFPPNKLNDGLNHKIPHVGWNKLIKPSKKTDWKGTVLDLINEEDDVYFVHSFVAVPDDENQILAQTEYGGNIITAVIKNGNIYGCQFHAEKSRETGLKILKSFINTIREHKVADGVAI